MLTCLTRSSRTEANQHLSYFERRRLNVNEQSVDWLVKHMTCRGYIFLEGGSRWFRKLAVAEGVVLMAGTGSPVAKSKPNERTKRN